MPCIKDVNQFCGAGLRNRLYNLKNLNPGNLRNIADESSLNCANDENGVIVLIDCTFRGGYDYSDPCFQTCIYEAF